MALIAEDAKAAADVVGANMTVAADTGPMEITNSDVVIAPQSHTPSVLTDSLIKKTLTAQNRAL